MSTANSTIAARGRPTKFRDEDCADAVLLRRVRGSSMWKGARKGPGSAPGPQTDRQLLVRRLTPSLELRGGCSLRPTGLTAWHSRVAKLVVGVAAVFGRRPGLVDQFLTQHLHVRRRIDAEADAASLDRHDVNRDVETGQDDLLMRSASQDQHSKTPFQTVQTNTGRGSFARR